MNPIIQTATMMLPDGSTKKGFTVTMVYDFTFILGGGPSIEWFDDREAADARAKAFIAERAEAEARIKAKFEKR